MLFLFKLIVLSIIQGIGEILPISSSGHLVMLSNLLDLETNGMSVEILLHIASLMALLFYYYDLIKKIIKGTYMYLIRKDYSCYLEWSYFTTLIIATIPVCIVGLMLNNYLDRLTSYVGLFLIINGIIMCRLKNIDSNKEISDLSLLDKFKIGLYEIMGLIPGISRSGSCLFGCSKSKLNKEDSFNLSFLLLFPLVIGSLVLNINEFDFSRSLLIPYIIVFLITALLTYISMVVLHHIVINNKNKIFGMYCICMGMVYSIILMW